ncbi:hypothetical protein SUGI_0631410 [Cryptomeria japonica]|uniref:floral homeotic protein APETALA 1 C n=1 Tax=Cryptomeria japonica TaxID=3369 RepID=UPI002414A44B|nr:floral homeotic protein APETALA 1 C [Cryptomeria japonica]GLJ31461.1 hypothetical protein SUGI_0631410 [Cryptomeria japonica]
MGKKKIPITFVEDPVKRKIHFHKRVHGLFKKLHELSVLCGAPMCLIVEDENKISYCYKTDSGGHAKLIAAEYDKLNVSDKVKVYDPATRTFHNKLKVVRELEDHDQGMIALQNATAEVATVLDGTAEVQLHGDSNLHSAHPGNEDDFSVEWLENFLLSEDDDKDGHNPPVPT